MSDRPSPRALRFGDFELNVPAYELRRRGRRVKLERLAMDLLILLVDQRDRLVTRNEIVERLWGPDVFLEVDASVNTLVRKLRRVFVDTVEHPRFIQTVQGKGYRFIAKVETTVEPGVESPIVASAPADIRTPIRRLSGRGRLAAGVALLGTHGNHRARRANGLESTPRRYGECADSRRSDALRKPDGRS